MLLGDHGCGAEINHIVGVLELLQLQRSATTLKGFRCNNAASSPTSMCWGIGMVLDTLISCREFMVVRLDRLSGGCAPNLV